VQSARKGREKWQKGVRDSHKGETAVSAAMTEENHMATNSYGSA
jgi:hypothetical protein